MSLIGLLQMEADVLSTKAELASDAKQEDGDVYEQERMWTVNVHHQRMALGPWKRWRKRMMIRLRQCPEPTPKIPSLSVTMSSTSIPALHPHRQHCWVGSKGMATH
jgi:hypothetical protein